MGLPLLWWLPSLRHPQQLKVLLRTKCFNLCVQGWATASPRSLKGLLGRAIPKEPLFICEFRILVWELAHPKSSATKLGDIFLLGPRSGEATLGPPLDHHCNPMSDAYRWHKVWGDQAQTLSITKCQLTIDKRKWPACIDQGLLKVMLKKAGGCEAGSCQEKPPSV